jgi:UDP:flavonoid glycosyltransferase YjiC (YdhE family)
LAGGNLLREPASNGVMVIPYAPFSAIFPRASVIVHQGGIGTCGQALAAGRPMLVLPFAFDQPDNAARLQRLGVARTIPRREYRAGRVYSELDQMLRDPSYAAKTAVVAGIIANENGVRSASDAIERHSHSQ